MKTFELTQEQIDRLAEKKHAKELLQKFIPYAFENKLEVGKWYKPRNERIKSLFVPNKEQCDGNMGYGFNFHGEFKESHFNLIGSSPNDFELATEEEVREALINEAKKRGFNNIGNLKIKNTVGSISNGFVTITNDFYYDYKGNTLKLDGAVIFNNGVWAEIIEEPTKEEINRVLNYLLKNGEKLHNKI